MSPTDLPAHHATADPVVHLETPVGEAVIRRRRWLYATTSLVLATIMGLGVVDGLSVVDVYGVDSAWVRAEGGGYGLQVRYGTVSRPALATPFDIVVDREGGFTEPLVVAVDRRYIGIWDENGLNPGPASETAVGPWLVWEFDPPEGDTFTISYDARIEPAVQEGRSGRVAVLEDGVPVVEVAFSTEVRP